MHNIWLCDLFLCQSSQDCKKVRSNPLFEQPYPKISLEISEEFILRTYPRTSNELPTSSDRWYIQLWHEWPNFTTQIRQILCNLNGTVSENSFFPQFERVIAEQLHANGRVKALIIYRHPMGTTSIPSKNSKLHLMSQWRCWIRYSILIG